MEPTSTPPSPAGSVAADRLLTVFALLLGLALPALLLASLMWRVHTFTIDDAFISFRYARNLADGRGLVYNEGARVEGYTNFLFTLLIAGGIKAGFDAEALAKGIGALSAFGSLGLTYAIAARMAPYRGLPCVATWLLASSAVFTGWSVFGLETSLFVFLILLGTYLFLRETRLGAGPSPPPTAAEAIPWSGLAFAAAGLTRPEAPVFVGLLMLALGRGIAARQNRIRGALFLGPLLLHLAFRRAYYGAWLPTTFDAKTGDTHTELAAGARYVRDYLGQAGPALYVALLGGVWAVRERRRDVLALAALAAGVAAYVVFEGGDWMHQFRFMAPLEPSAFLLIDFGARRTVDRYGVAAGAALALFIGFLVVPQRRKVLRDAQVDVKDQKRFWDAAAGGSAKWLLQQPRGEVALSDIGYIGWATDYPVLDLLGLVDPVIARLPGGYRKKTGPGFADRIFEVAPRYTLLISGTADCAHPAPPGLALWSDARFAQQYALASETRFDRGFAWCIFERTAQ